MQNRLQRMEFVVCALTVVVIGMGVAIWRNTRQHAANADELHTRRVVVANERGQVRGILLAADDGARLLLFGGPGESQPSVRLDTAMEDWAHTMRDDAMPWRVLPRGLVLSDELGRTAGGFLVAPNGRMMVAVPGEDGSLELFPAAGSEPPRVAQ